MIRALVVLPAIAVLAFLLALVCWPRWTSDPWPRRQHRDQILACMNKGGVAIFNRDVSILTTCIFPTK